MMVDLGHPKMVNEDPNLSPSLEGSPLRYFTTDIVTELAYIVGIPSVLAAKSVDWLDVLPFVDGEPLEVLIDIIITSFYFPSILAYNAYSIFVIRNILPFSDFYLRLANSTFPRWTLV